MVLSFDVMAYREVTHQDLSQEALKISNIADDDELLSNLGLDSYSQLTLPSPSYTGKEKTIVDLVRDGAKFEDGGTRALSHFYNPITNQGLSAGNPSPDWAIEDNGDVSHLTAGDQEYSYKEAMNYFHLALTSQTEEVRNQNWGELFQTLGQVIHHVQDMAQPDHARNDAHCDTPWCALIGQYEPSWYEEYTNNHKGDSYFTNLMSGNSYPIPSFPTAREYWTTRATDSAVVSRRGMADYTNRNFVSKDTIFQFHNGSIVTHSEFPNPVPNITPVTVSIADPNIKGAQGQAVCDNIKARSIIPFPPSACYMDFVSTPVNDAITGASGTNDRAATYSIFDKKLQDHNIDAIYIREDGSIDTIDRSFTLNEFNFKAAHNYLIPRAVAYSAGLINHFFRGKIDMIPNPNGEGWVIQNLSDEEMEGTFTLYYDYVDPADGVEKREEIPGAIWNLTITANTETVVGSYTIPAGLIRKVLVFTGSIGSENTITAKLIKEGWGVPILIASSQQQMSKPRIGTDATGNVLVAWEQQGNGQLNIWSNRYDVLTGSWDVLPFQVDAGTGNKSIYVYTELIYVDIANNVGHVIWKEFLNFQSFLPFENQLQMISNDWRGVLVNSYPINTSNPSAPPTILFSAVAGTIQLLEQSGNLNAQHFNTTTGVFDDPVAVELLSGNSSDATIAENAADKVYAAWVQFDGANYAVYINTYN